MSSKQFYRAEYRGRMPWKMPRESHVLRSRIEPKHSPNIFTDLLGCIHS
ncbi:MAG: hypothetical protein AB4290_22875 [Spirulina sp.]